ncbi:hypothetical protein HPB50_015447 [Hyalomma asiaticum]|uniref:Uncharacterized protein n=1 Tax=Hyalomma asiaticum TaxID=266040 RepID=A0ACB7T9Z4_HYAAI|nr:hypothetical protein HPB50_015447 [Hyalomma asiaticum]
MDAKMSERSQEQVRTSNQESGPTSDAVSKGKTPSLVPAPHNAPTTSTPAVTPGGISDALRRIGRPIAAIALSTLNDLSRNAGPQLSNHILEAYPAPEAHSSPHAPQGYRKVPSVPESRGEESGREQWQDGVTPSLLSQPDNAHAKRTPTLTSDGNGGPFRRLGRSFATIALSALAELSRNAGAQLTNQLLEAYSDPEAPSSTSTSQGKRSVPTEPERKDKATETDQQHLSSPTSVLRMQPAQYVQDLPAAFLQTSDVNFSQPQPDILNRVPSSEVNDKRRNAHTHLLQDIVPSCSLCAGYCNRDTTQVIRSKQSEPLNHYMPVCSWKAPITNKSECLKRTTQEDNTASLPSKRPRVERGAPGP